MTTTTSGIQKQWCSSSFCEEIQRPELRLVLFVQYRLTVLPDMEEEGRQPSGFLRFLVEVPLSDLMTARV